MFREIVRFIAPFFLALTALSTGAQSMDDAVRVTVTMNADGSKTVYRTNESSIGRDHDRRRWQAARENYLPVGRRRPI